MDTTAEEKFRQFRKLSLAHICIGLVVFAIGFIRHWLGPHDDILGIFVAILGLVIFVYYFKLWRKGKAQFEARDKIKD